MVDMTYLILRTERVCWEPENESNSDRYSLRGAHDYVASITRDEEGAYVVNVFAAAFRDNAGFWWYTGTTDTLHSTDHKTKENAVTHVVLSLIECGLLDPLSFVLEQ